MTRNRIFAALTAVVLGAGGAQAATLIDDATEAIYNMRLGLALDGTNPVGDTFLFPAANVSGGDPTIDVGPDAPPDLSAAATALGNWLTDPVAPGGMWHMSPKVIPASWRKNTETAIIYTIDGGLGGLRNVRAEFGVDNGIFVWLNGVFLGGHLRPGPAIQGEFALDIGRLGPGLNYLQVLREDHGRGRDYTVLVSGDVSTVPLPAGGWLLLGGLALLPVLRRRT